MSKENRDTFEPMNRIYIFVVLLAVCGSSCSKRKEFPIEPVITLKSFVITGTSANLIFNFTDGDGNFGLKDDQFPTDTIDCPKHYNVFLEYYELQNGQWVNESTDPCSGNPNAHGFYYRVPLVEPTGQLKTQEGEVKIAMNQLSRPSVFDTCRFEIRVVDYDQNESNIIQTQEFLKP